jgi:hypothetical protein
MYFNRETQLELWDLWEEETPTGLEEDGLTFVTVIAYIWYL